MANRRIGLRILIADDDPDCRLVLKNILDSAGYDTLQAQNGLEAWRILESDDPPQLLILDRSMPLMDGIQLCRKARKKARAVPFYVIFLTALGSKSDIVGGLNAGADDYLTKPFDLDELRARVQVGERILRLQHDLAARVKELEEAVTRVTQLQGLLPICSYCKKIRDDRNYWHQVEQYLSEHADARFTHSICPECLEKMVNSMPPSTVDHP